MQILMSLILTAVVLSGFAPSKAHAGLFTSGGIIARTCEGLLMEYSDRRLYTSSKSYGSQDLAANKARLKEGIESWIKNTKKYLPESAEKHGDQVWSEYLVSKTLGRWTNLIRENLIQQSLLKGEINRDQPEWTFILERESLLKLYPEVQKFQVPDSYSFAIAPASWLNNWEMAAMTDPVKRLIYLPPSVLWELSDEDKITVLHEVIHARLEAGRSSGQVSFFPFVFHFEGELSKQLEGSLGSYARTIFSGEEIATRLVTFAYRLDQYCAGNYNGNFHEETVSDGLGVYTYSSSYIRDVLPLMISHLRLTKSPKFTENENGYLLEMEDPGFQPLLEADAFRRYFTSKARGTPSLDRVLINEKTWSTEARHILLPMLRESNEAHNKKKVMNWKAYCGYTKALWAHASQLGLDLNSLRSKK